MKWFSIDRKTKNPTPEEVRDAIGEMFAAEKLEIERRTQEVARNLALAIIDKKASVNSDGRLTIRIYANSIDMKLLYDIMAQYGVKVHEHKIGIDDAITIEFNEAES